MLILCLESGYARWHLERRNPARGMLQLRHLQRWRGHSHGIAHSLRNTSTSQTKKVSCGTYSRHLAHRTPHTNPDLTCHCIWSKLRQTHLLVKLRTRWETLLWHMLQACGILFFSCFRHTPMRLRPSKFPPLAFFKSCTDVPLWSIDLFCSLWPSRRSEECFFTERC